MQDRVFTAEQLVPVSRAEVFAFFSDPRNLEAITPPWLQFRVVDRTTEDVRESSELTYRLKLRGIPLTWVSRISEWVPGERFVDEQIRGPYAKWHHTHTFEDVPGGTRIGDRVLYRLPLAPLSHWIAGGFVAADVRKIFKFRRRRIEELLSAEATATMKDA
jgi:ligand-binding SRPBCC domain-containing protein